MISKDDGTLGEITFTIVQIKIIIVISYAFTRMGDERGKWGQNWKWTYWLTIIGTETKMGCIKFYEGNDRAWRTI